MRKRMILGILCSLAAIILVSCKETDVETKERKYVGVACYDQSDEFLGELMTCFKDICHEYNLAVTTRDAAGSQKVQNDQVKEMIDEGCSLLCINLADRTDPSEIIDMARENDVPIIFFNREPVLEDLQQWDKLYYVGANARQSGTMQGELAADFIQERADIDKNKDGKIQYVVLEGETGHQDAIIRTESAIDTLKDCGIELEKLSCGIANWNRAQAQNRMTQMIGEFHSKIEIVLANNDAMALGAIDAYKELDYKEEEMPVFFGIDGTQEGLRAVRESKLAATVYNDKEGQAQEMAKLADALIKNEEISEFEFENDKCIYLPYAKVTAENADTYMKENKEGK